MVAIDKIDVDESIECRLARIRQMSLRKHLAESTQFQDNELLASSVAHCKHAPRLIDGDHSRVERDE